MRALPIWLAVSIIAVIGTVHSQEISDVYSNIELADATIAGDVSGDMLRFDLVFAGQVLQTVELSLDGPGTWIAKWESFEAEKGSYQVCVRLMSGDRELSKKCYEFFYAGETPVRFDVRDFNADSRGMHLSILSQDATLVDIYYMLITRNKAIYISKDESVPISSSMPSQLDRSWHQILEDGREYSGLVKIVELSHNVTRAYLKSFIAKDDATITETYEDETGASATVLGNSRVPFEGKLNFTLFQNGTVLETIEKKTPVLLTGKDETVEISWNKTLNPGVYQLRVVLIGNMGEIRDVRESVIEAKPIPKPVNSTAAQQKSPLGAELGLIAMIAAAVILRRSKQG
jgi:hypothetical protein